MLDECDDLARLSTAEGRGKARNVPDRVSVFRLPTELEMEPTLRAGGWSVGVNGDNANPNGASA